MKTDNILFISYDGMTDPLGQSQVIPYLKGLTAYGYRFTILSCEKPDRLALHKKEIEESIKEFAIKWSPIAYHKTPPVLSTVYDLVMLKRKAKQLHRKEKFDMVHTRAGTPSLVGLWMKKKFGVKFLHDVRDFFADSRIDSGSWNYDNPMYRAIYHYFKKIEKEELEHCDGVVCLTNVAREIITQLPHYDKQKIIEVIPCSVDMNLFDPGKIDSATKEKLKEELDIHDNDIVFSYLGTTGGWYLTDQTMQLCSHISTMLSNVKFLFITPDDPQKILALAEKFGVNTARIIVKYAKRSEVPVLLSLSQYSTFFIKPCFSKKSSSPTKHGEIMAMGIPVITNAGVGDVKEIVEKYKSGFVMDSFSPVSFNEVINNIDSSRKFDQAAIRAGAREFYSLEKAIRKYYNVYNTILRKPVYS